MATLFAAQVCGSTGHAIGMAVGSIMAASVTGTNSLPVAVGALAEIDEPADQFPRAASRHVLKRSDW